MMNDNPIRSIKPETNGVGNVFNVFSIPITPIQFEVEPAKQKDQKDRRAVPFPMHHYLRLPTSCNDTKLTAVMGAVGH